MPDQGSAIYRGWMLDLNQMEKLEKTLADKNITLKTSALLYKQSHHLQGWVATFANLTPRTIFIDPFKQEDLEKIKSFKQAVIKDQVKSLKENWQEASFIEDASSDEEVQEKINKFIELRGSSLVLPLSIREYEDWEDHEYRTWWVDNQLLKITSHPLTPYKKPSQVEEKEIHELKELQEAVQKLNHPFLCVDLIKNKEGSWRVVEIGDGQVSDCPPDYNLFSS